MKKKFGIFLVVVIILAVICGGVIFGVKSHFEEVNQQEIDASVHGVVIGEDVGFYNKAQTSKVKQLKTLQKGEQIYILDEFENEGIEWYKIKVDGKRNGYVRADMVSYYKDVNAERVLMVDVSQFNMSNNFESQEDFQAFVIERGISYVYIRAGGRGYGSAGNFYYDESYELFRNACEFLGVPYGYYFLEEALDSNEIDEEVAFITRFLAENKGEYCILPVALDIESHDGKGRADNIWDKRYKLVREVISDLKKAGVQSIVYSNAQTANLYLSRVNTKFWLAYYPQENKVPSDWLFDRAQPVAENTRLNKRTIGWQFTETGAGNQIPESLDVSLVKKDFWK